MSSYEIFYIDCTRTIIHSDVFRGGSSLRYYFEKVARHHGLEYAVTEYEKAEGEFNKALIWLFVHHNGNNFTMGTSRSWFTRQEYVLRYQSPRACFTINQWLQM